MIENDTQFQVHKVNTVKNAGVDDTDRCFELCIDSGWHIIINNPKNLPVPNPGDEVRFYGRGIGHPVRGVSCGEYVYYYVTEEEDEKRHQQEVQTIKQKKRDAFTANMPRWENDLLGLPEPFQKRIQRFVDRNPDWCWEFGPYEMFCCREAVKIINRIKTIEALQVFVAAKYDEQKQIIPELEYNEHSGNTFGASVHLAAVYLNDPAMIPLAHGALCPLVGCQSYGCYAAECEPERETQ